MADSFFNVPQTTLETSSGAVKFPIFYYDVSVLMAFFWLDYDKARNTLKDTDLETAKFFNGKALGGLAWYEYRETDIGEYNEVGVGIAAYPRGIKAPLFHFTQFLTPSDGRKLGFYITDLPVTTEIANSAGREMWGFPKFVTEIRHSFGKRDFEGGIALPENLSKNIISLKGSYGICVPSPAMDLTLFSFLDKKRLFTTVNIKASFQTCLKNNLVLKVEDKTHPMGSRLEAMGLDGKSPFLVQVSHKFNSRLNLGKEV